MYKKVKKYIRCKKNVYITEDIFTVTPYVGSN